MASYSRTKRIAEEIKKVISTMLISGIKDPRINSMVSVTDVEVTSDLSYAYVYISILGGDEESTLTGLRSAVNYIRREVSRNVKLRHTPQIIFKVDDSIKNGMYMDTLIKKVNEGKTANEIDEEMFDEE
ncbi:MULTISPECIES: 30S ribosome-binding factor RbfA [Romboutsia]|uniref:Ribosome-binding factor A n=2 Tax=Romboutsia hominis TaxID=1507512 RepID=A0A2P2BT38_9FIRM|nr:MULTISPECIES: 30S ribosome-binding factor RbfA [Romboutsia]MCH1960813.1 30S ribosome-binding factor RbfA [Romboutsia hominis]MDB8789859.1 30S ribosome-binding factor RbfA [Romboutsia sp. 1001216sp1]MDB8793727.1 30S ribosome-binding factor RbfA [Romboutsia sp. 1001216sp1]MDB8795124.1 30S ribosome-binding factor RbfA [Romboutsia sp. 1001216sp1]MDB8798934.1 30S ribosome-binding factor RbfA [Romboutsia sp. 1001216sp1]